METAEILSLLGLSAPIRRFESNRAQPTQQQHYSSYARPTHPQTSSQFAPPHTTVLRPSPYHNSGIGPSNSRVHPNRTTSTMFTASGPQNSTSVASGRRTSILPPTAEGTKKRKRSKTSPEQLRVLMEEFQREPMPNATTRQTLAATLGMTPRSVQVWFQNMVQFEPTLL